MGLSSTEIYMGISLLPAALLLLYIYKMDRIEKEPKGLLVGLFFLGVGATIPSMIVEVLLQIFNNGLFYGSFSYEDMFMPYNGKLYLYEFVNNFFGIALVEEGFKWLFMFLLTRKSKNFNCWFDGVVYAAFVSLGFAAAENVVYVFSGGLITGVLRMVTAVPGHCAFAVVMGYFYSRWFICRNSGALEKNLVQNRVVSANQTGFGAGKYLLLSIVLPTAIHGFYDFCCTFTDSDINPGSYGLYWVLLFLFLGFLYLVCFRNVYVLSKKDAYISYLCMEMVLKRYPSADQYLCRMPEHIVFFTPAVIEQSIANREPHGVKTTVSNLYYAHPIPAVKPKPAPRPVVYPQQTYYGQPMQNAQPMMNGQYAQPMQNAQPVMNGQYAQPMQNAQPVMNQSYAQPMQNAQPVMNQPYARPMQNAQPVMNQPYAQPMQNAQPVMNQQYAQPVQNAQSVVNQQYAQPTQNAQPTKIAEPAFTPRPVVDEEPYTRQLDNLEPVGGYRPYGGAPITHYPQQDFNPYNNQ